MYDPAYRYEDAEEHQEPADAEVHIVEFHDAGPVEPLADLNGESDDQDHSHDVKERDDHRMAGLRKPQEDGVQDQDQGDAEGADDKKVQLFVGQAVLALVVQRQEIAVDPRDQHDDIIKKCLHLDSPFRLCKGWVSFFVSHSITALCED